MQATIHSSNIEGNVDIALYRINKETGLVDDTIILNTNIDSYSKAYVSADWDLSSAYAINVYIDEAGNFDEDKSDNFVYRLIYNYIPKAYLSVNTSYPEVDYLIKNYLKQYVNYVENIDEAELIISVGKFTGEFKTANPETLKPSGLWWWKELGYGYKNGGVFAYGDYAYATYNGIVERTEYNNKPLILAYGIGIDGDIASVKKLISSRELFFSDISNPEKPPVIMDKYDTLALGINDLLKVYKDYSSPAFLSVVNKILYDNSYDVAIRTVKTLDTTSYGESTLLRLKNVNSDYSKDFKDAISDNDKPVVFSGGLFSDLFRWEEDNGLALQLAQEGRDTWEIEINGGPQIECDTCSDYTYQDQVDYFWPALIAGIQQYSRKNSLQYIGHSNGCRVALDSLKNYSATGKNNAGYYFDTDTGQYLLTDLTTDPIDTFFGLGCPGALEGDSEVISKGIENGDSAISHFENIGQAHITGREFAKRLELLGVRFWSPDLVSLNLIKFYHDLATSLEDNQPGFGLSLNNFYLVAGNKAPLFYNPRNGNDGLVPLEDMIAINSTVSYTNGELKIFKISHNEQIDNEEIHDYIKDKLGG